ncbi:hypothetical protein HTZ97_05425 [Desulfuromonas acetoxidans]|uniref:hypothetical protein n=1 Tax=Desulfuromonas acetoxidans TaxID=891 RepID=UPI001593A565|nr:hypothetical protein [Desulfuromonas acetoxidans]MBF0644689.1 hypothetical protein [Desulfuromonas acetoxidans]NVE15899.1 hypothetical protein [Desulfuromonas acetoxidans]
MKRSFTLLVFFSVLFALMGVMTDKVHNLRTKYLAASISQIGRIPSSVLVATSLEYKGVVADMMFLNASNFIGRNLMERRSPQPEEWQTFYLMLDRMSALDGRFLDTYVFAEMMLAWQARMYDEANSLLAKARRYRPDDWRMPYYIGFNHFYFQKQYALGADYVMQAANISGSPSYLPNLAARLAFYGSRSKTALLFIKELIAQNKQIELNPELEKRLAAFEAAASIEDAAVGFINRFDRRPVNISELVKTGFLSAVPLDPYGGEWRLYIDGHVDSTSNFIEREK